MGERETWGGVDGCVWGKQRGLPDGLTYPLLCHLLDTAAAAGAVWDALVSPGCAERVAEELGVSPAELRALVMFWAGLHDVGKASVDFQSLVGFAWERLRAGGGYEGEPGAAGFRLGHDVATHRALAPLLAQLGYATNRLLPKFGVDQQIAQILGGHHGVFHAQPSVREAAAPTAYAPGLGGGGWEEQRRAHVEVLRQVTGARGGLVKAMSAPSAVVVAAVVVVADWLASQEHLVLPRLPGPGWVADEQAVAGHWELACSQAAAVVAAAGLGRVEKVANSGFAQQFPKITVPNGLQVSLDRELPKVVGGPGMLLITAPPGDGKSEAALFSATVLGRVAGVLGVCLALPTMATVDAIVDRVEEFSLRNLVGAPAVTVVHSMAWLRRVRASDVREGPGGQVLAQEPAEAATWLWGRSRGLLAQVAAVTIDQLLLAVLPVRWNALRLFAASRSVVVIDEAHAYGPWMHTLVTRLLQWLGAMGAPVVVMSATVTGKVARSLVEAYRSGAGHAALEGEWEVAYPGWVFVDGASGQVSAPRRVASQRARQLRLDSVDVRVEAAVDQEGSRLAVVRAELEKVVTGGGCALVVCTTVAQAQATYDMLEKWFAGLPAAPWLGLLHARFPAWRREERAVEALALFGKDAGIKGQPARPVAAVLVATQVVEQSVDLDFDLVITDSAPIALIIQRAGRCQRHDHHQRPAWVRGVRVVVLRSVDEKGLARRPRCWGTVYDEGLLVSTHGLLERWRDRPVRVPEDVQELVEAVYAEPFTQAEVEVGGADAGLGGQQRQERLWIQRQAAEGAQEALARMVAIKAPADCRDLSVLSSRKELDAALITTRLGADSERMVCLYPQPGGEATLDPGGLDPLPLPDAKGRFTPEQVAAVMRWVIPVPGKWFQGADPTHLLRAQWAKTPLLASVRAVPVVATRDDTFEGKTGSTAFVVRRTGDVVAAAQ